MHSEMQPGRRQWHSNTFCFIEFLNGANSRLKLQLLSMGSLPTALQVLCRGLPFLLLFLKQLILGP